MKGLKLGGPDFDPNWGLQVCENTSKNEISNGGRIHLRSEISIGGSVFDPNWGLQVCENTSKKRN